MSASSRQHRGRDFWWRTSAGAARTYTVSVTGMTSDGTVIASIVSAAAATDAAGNTNTASTSTDNTVTYDTTPPTVDITSPPDGSSTIALTTAVSGTVFRCGKRRGLGKRQWLAGNSRARDVLLGASFVPLDCGPNTLTALATDNAGNTSTDSITVARITTSATCSTTSRSTRRSTPATPIINSRQVGRVIPTKITFRLADGTVVTRGRGRRAWLDDRDRC